MGLVASYCREADPGPAGRPSPARPPAARLRIGSPSACEAVPQRVPARRRAGTGQAAGGPVRRCVVLLYCWQHDATRAANCAGRHASVRCPAVGCPAGGLAAAAAPVRARVCVVAAPAVGGSVGQTPAAPCLRHCAPLRPRAAPGRVLCTRQLACCEVHQPGAGQGRGSPELAAGRRWLTPRSASEVLRRARVAGAPGAKDAPAATVRPRYPSEQFRATSSIDRGRPRG